MKRRSMVVVASVVAAVGLVVAALAACWLPQVVTIAEYHDPPDRGDLRLEDDRVEDKHPAFDAALVDSRPIGDWEINKSAAVIRLDCPAIEPEPYDWYMRLRPSYAQAAREIEFRFLPSANMLDGAAKQFDDGLYAAVDLACFRGELEFSPALPDFVGSLLAKLPAGSPARPFLAAALELVDTRVALGPQQQQQKSEYLREFRRSGNDTPLAFYNWTPELQRLWRFMTFLQREFSGDLAVPQDVASVLDANPDLLEQYRAINAFYGRLTNPLISLPVDSLIGTAPDLSRLAKEHGARRATVAIFPPATSRETELTDRLWPIGLPPDANIMNELMRRIRSGEVDLAPAPTDGWYQYQVHALETLLLPSKGQEAGKLLLTAKYKKRLIEAFKALMTKRRELHARTGAITVGMPPLGEGEVRPRLRIEPCATFYLRTARAYAFLEDFLLATVGGEQLDRLHGLRKGGMRESSLADELGAMRDRFYGFYLVACEDIGMRPHFVPGEPVDAGRSMRTALDWLKSAADDPDLACDTRVAVPVYVDPTRNRTRLWATLGVRLARLEASYVRPPKIRPREEAGEWQDVQPHQLGTSGYYITVDEFAEFEIEGLAGLTRAELRAVCDEHSTKDEILRALDAR